MIKKYAVIYNTIVENLISSDLPVEEIETFPERQLVEISEDQPLGYGYTYDGTNFIPPVMRENVKGDVSQLLVSLVSSLDENQKNSLLQLLNGEGLPSDEPPLPQTTL
jgi:hypothetical protein